MYNGACHLFDVYWIQITNMFLYLDVKYANMLSIHLEKFKVKQNNPYLANCRCPLCGDSEKNKNRARGYIYTKKSALFYKCHNCSAGITLGNLINRISPALYNDYKFERYREGGDIGKNSKPHSTLDFTFKTPEFQEERLLDKLLDRLDKLPEDHEAVKYCLDRKLPKKSLKRLYYIDDMKKIEQLSSKYKDRIVGTESRVVIPFYDCRNKLVGVSCRDIKGDSKVKYVNVLIDEDAPMIYNIDNVKFDELIYCVEGPLDSHFLPNCVAVGTSDLKKIGRYCPMDMTVLIFDNQPRNKELLKIMKKSAEMGYNMVIWPEDILEKDINEMIKDGGRSAEEVLDIINKNTYSGLTLQLKLAAWRKI